MAAAAAGAWKIRKRNLLKGHRSLKVALKLAGWPKYSQNRQTKLFRSITSLWAIFVATALGLGFLLCSPPALLWGFPIVSEQAPTLPLGLWGWRARGLFSDTTRGDRRREEGAAAMTLAYGVRHNWTLGASLPFIERELKETVDRERRKRISSGVGDIAVFTFYKFYQRDAFHYSEQAAFFGALKLPAGRTNDRDSQGRRLAPELQPGTGSTDFLLGPIFTHRMTLRFAWHANLFYRINTEGTQDFRFGNRLYHNLAAEFRFIIRPEISLILELNGEYADKSEKEGHRRAGTGGYVLFVTSGIQGTIPHTEKSLGLGSRGAAPGRGEFTWELTQSWHPLRLWFEKSLLRETKRRFSR